MATAAPQLEANADTRGKPVFRAYGASAEMLVACETEVLYEGAANTGKTRTVLEKCYLICSECPGIRMLWVRKTRKSMTESVLVTWEEHVLPPRHPCIVGTAQRGNRDHYEFPNGSRIVLGGMDNPDRIMSTEYDVIVYFEATEGRLDEWEKLITRRRNKRIQVGTYPDGKPRFWHQMIADCNPAHDMHWLNQRAKGGKMRRIMARHSDNPIFTPEDQEALDSLTGARRARLRDGLWVSAEGQVFEEYDPRLHHTTLNKWLLDPAEPTAGLKFDWYFAGLDFGTTHAQALEVFGCVGERVVRVAEVYKREKRYSWWGDAIEKVMDKFQVELIVADNNDLPQIDYLNDRLGPLGGRNEGELVVPVKKSPGYRMVNVEIVRDHLVDGQLLFATDALLEGECEVSKRKYKPTGLLDEIPDFRWKEIKDGQPVKDEPDPRCIDHGLDAMLMALGWRWGTDLTPEGRGGRFERGTMGAELDHDAVLDREEQWVESGADDEFWPDEFDDDGNLA